MAAWMGQWTQWRRDIAAAVAIGLFLGIIGPFGSFLNGGLAERVAYWTGMAVFGVVLYGIGMRWALHQGRRLGQPKGFVWATALAALAVPMSVVSAVCCTALWPAVAGHIRPFDWYAEVLVLSLPINLLWLWSRQRASARTDDPGGRPAKPFPAHGRVLCLQMEDHYVRVHTETSSELVLSPLRDAIDALEGIDGLQVHRSWWVAREAVKRPIWSGRKVELELANGVRAPVSRACVARLRAAGWLGDASSENRRFS